MALYPFKGTNKRHNRKQDGVGDMRNISEESILGNEGIMKTVEMRVEEDFMKEKEEIRSGGTQGYEGRGMGLEMSEFSERVRHGV
jgi:hypothetical protein